MYNDKHQKYLRKTCKIIEKKTYMLNKDYNFGNSVQKNIETAYNNWGEIFNLMSKSLNMQVTVFINKQKTVDNKYVYSLEYFQEKKNSDILPFRIEFYDVTTGQLNNTTYISDISKTEQYTGTQIVNFCLEINKMFKVKKVYLHDGSTIDCYEHKISLNIIKLLENKKTFYMKLGFNLEKNINSAMYPLLNSLSNDQYSSKIMEVIDKIRKIKTVDFIKKSVECLDLLVSIQKNITDQDYNLEIKDIDVRPISQEYITYHSNPVAAIKYYISKYIDIINIVKPLSKIKYFYQVLINLFKNKCYDYNTLYLSISFFNFYELTYNGKTITNNIKYYFSELNDLVSFSIYSYTF